MKRFTVIFLSLILVISSCLVIVSADSVSFSPSCINLLDYPSFEVKVGAGTYVESDTPIVKHSTNGAAYFRWGDNNNKMELGSITVGVECMVEPTSVYFLWGNSQIIGTLIGSDVGIYYYNFVLPDIGSDYFQVWVYVPNGYRLYTSIVSCVGFLTDSRLADPVSISFYGQADDAELFYRQDYYSASVSAPFNYDKFFESNSTAPEQFFVELEYEFHSSNISSFSLMFSSTNIWPNYYSQDTISQGGFRLMDDGNVIAVLPYTFSDSISTFFYEGCPQYVYTLTVDLTGYDLSGKSLVFNSYMGPVYPINSSSSTYTMYQFSFLGASYNLDFFNQPWYIRFYHWIKSEFDEIDSKLDRFFESGNNDISDQQQGMNDVIGDMGGLADDFENSQNEMEQLMPSMPSWEDTGLGDLPGQYGANINQILAIYHAIYENTIITQILTFTFLFALGGFILFGER